MNRLRWLGVAVVGLALCATLQGQDKKDPPKKGSLPTYFKELGLNEDQAKKVKQVHADYKEKIDSLKQQIKDLQNAEKSEYDKILTADQKKTLREIIEKKILGDKDKTQKDKDDKKDK